MITTEQIERLLGSNVLPTNWTIADLARSKGKHPTQCSRQVGLMVKNGAIKRVGNRKNKWGKPFGIYQFLEQE
ncbi:hypothetical protein [Limnobacter litoralis]|uniref:MarR family transcriptional regulator n=1 Tax=Limnobacter litoralis TaxID=481366 RepID=A0ABQ5YRX8_9BURK|nr:hypothetical protein [Limnobacter litoralis]GLR26545.1 hypothetical protein GCM10007875_16350 [Limnobacter litoralis]